MKKLLSVVLVISSVFLMILAVSCSSEELKEDNGDKNGLSSIVIDGKSIECGMDMKEVLENFKDLEFEYSESISCAYNGLDKIYDFTDAGFVVYTYPDGDKDYVLEVTVSSNEIKQLNNKVYVDMTRDELVGLFGDKYTAEGDIITYTVEDKQTMYFLIEDNKVMEYAISIAE